MGFPIIRVTSIKRCKTSEYDKIYLIIRSTASLERSRSGILQHAEQVADLSPSRNLFYQYLNWQKTGEWNQQKFDTEYKPVFLNELNNNPNAENWLEYLAECDMSGQKIALLCFCTDENTCHRKIIGEILKERGCNVIFDSDLK